MAEDQNLDDFGDLGADLDDEGAVDLNLDDDSDFSSDLDDIVGGDLGDESSSSDDSELDSFFEDLSSIDDLDTPDLEEDDVSEDDLDEAVEEAPKKESTSEQIPADKTEKKNKKPLLIGAAAMTLTAIIAGLYLFFSGGEKPIPEEPQLQPEIMTPSLTVEKVEEEKPTLLAELPEKEEKPLITLEKKVVKPKPVVKIKKKASGRYLVQVATCSFIQCRNDYVDELRRRGLSAIQKSSYDNFDMIELVSKQIYSRDKAEIVLSKLIENNKMYGYPSIVSQSNGFRVSMGTFPALKRAKEIKFHLEKAFPSGNLIFNLEHVQTKQESTKVFAGPFASKEEARKIVARLRKNRKFSDAFITAR